jgi:dihydroorotate dehydrogenase
MDDRTLPSYPINIMGLDFPNPVGLAAGFDRDGSQINSLSKIGFGFIEIGTINVNSELDSDDELENIIRNLEHSKNQSTNQTLVGISLGSLRDTIDDHTVADYLQGMEKFWHYSDYIVINLSRPGSSARSETDIKTELHSLLKRVKQRHTELCERHNKHVPIIIKAAIDYETRKTQPEILIIASELEFDGLLIAFEYWPSSSEMVETVYEISSLTNQMPLIVVGGIKKEDDVLQLLNAGANLVQCYTLLAVHGPVEMEKMIFNLMLLTKQQCL